MKNPLARKTIMKITLKNQSNEGKWSVKPLFINADKICYNCGLIGHI